MSSAARHSRQPEMGGELTLANGDRMQQPEFHRRYLAYPDKSKFELIAGTVYMASPLGWSHGRFHIVMGWLLETYALETPGIEGADNATAILDEENEPQPDLTLRVTSEYGGRSSITKEGFLKGPPELIVEVARSSRAIDLHQKRITYRRAGVQEYVVVEIEGRQVTWFDFHSRRTLLPNRDGICKSRVFPGLWLTVPGVMGQNKSEMLATLRAGLQSPEHAAFLEELQARRNRRS